MNSKIATRLVGGLALCVVQTAGAQGEPWWVKTDDPNAPGHHIYYLGATPDAAVNAYAAANPSETSGSAGCETYWSRSTTVTCGELPPVPPHEYAGLIAANHCVDNEHFVGDGNLDHTCLASTLFSHDRHDCERAGDPIYPLTGLRRQEQPLGFSIGGQSVTIGYDTLALLPASNAVGWTAHPLPAMGPNWQTSLHRNTMLYGDGSVAASSAKIKLGTAPWFTTAVPGMSGCANVAAAGARDTGANKLISSDEPDRVLTISNGVAHLVDGDLMTEDDFNVSDYLYNEATRTAFAQGGSLSYLYDPAVPPLYTPLLRKVTDQFGREVHFDYEQADETTLPRIAYVTAPDGTRTHAQYDAAGNLSTLTWGDSSVLTFSYTDTRFPQALTGVVDENGHIHATYQYDEGMRASSTTLAAGRDQYAISYTSKPALTAIDTLVYDANAVCREFSWSAPTGVVVTGPKGQRATLGAVSANGMNYTSDRTQPAGAGCGASTSKSEYDARGNRIVEDDFNGSRTCRAFDQSRNLAVAVLEGLPSTTACPANLSTYTPSESDPTHPQRRITTIWHPDWRLKAREASPRKITSWVYNGQIDPTTPQVQTPVTCAPASATLPDGKPIAVLCLRYEQPTTDLTGGAGITAQNNAGPPRVWKYFYNQYGQQTSETLPKRLASAGDAHSTTTYTYYDNTTPDTAFATGAGHTIGDLQQITDPLQHSTVFTAYDKAGRLLASTDANRAITQRTYFPRGWLRSQTVVATDGTSLVTTYDYWPTGLLKTVVLPGGSTLGYVYNDAHDLTDVTDGVGNTLHYVLDQEGRRTSEQIKDASGTLASSVSRVYDMLNRVQSVTGARN